MSNTPSGPGSAAPPTQPASRTIIVADDEAHIRAVLSAKLRGAGLTVHEARDGQEGFELAKAHTPDLVITDLQMPQMWGVDFARAMFNEPCTRNIPVILLTARGYVLNSDDLGQTSIRHTMSKPFSAKEVLQRVQEMLSITPAAPGAKPASSEQERHAA